MTFDYPAEGDTGPERTDAGYAEEFQGAPDEAVRLRLRADVPVGCYLSGGLDSCAVLGLAARASNAPFMSEPQPGERRVGLDPREAVARRRS